MFGLIVSGRPVQMLEAVTGDPNQTKFVSAIPQPESVNHIVLFLSQPLPDGIGAGVYFSWPEVASGASVQNWTYLGFLSNTKPSAIYKIVKPKHSDGDQGSLQHTTAISLFGGSCTPNVAAVGISLESLANLALMSTSVSEASTKSSNEEFCIKMLQNFANYASSFSITNPANPAEAYVPLKTVNAWFDNFKRRLEMDPNFWK